jgi:hypothetical protein
VTDPAAWSTLFTASIEPLWPLAGAGNPGWAGSPAPLRRQRQIARDLIESVLRFNQRWQQFVDRINLDPTNHVIEQYNRYYVLEKECFMGSPRRAARHFTPVSPITVAMLIEYHPTLPVPEQFDRQSVLDRG